jgi:hypothetical protein
VSWLQYPLAVGIIVAAFWLGLRFKRFWWQEIMAPSADSRFASDMTQKQREDRYRGYFGTWKPRDL